MTNHQLERDWQRLRDAAERLKNWGKWGSDDQAGTVNYITPEMIRAAAALINDGNVFSLSIDYGETGPQSGHLRRFNPMSFMMRDGDDGRYEFFFSARPLSVIGSVGGRINPVVIK
jgi:hypothetical protein